MDIPMEYSCQAGPRRKIHVVIQRSDRVRGRTAAKSSIPRCRENP